MGGPGVLAAKNTGSHCAGGTATGWLVCASLLATLDFVCGRKAVRKAAATPMSTSTRKLEASFLSYRLRWGGGLEGTVLQGNVWCSQNRVVLVLTSGRARCGVVGEV